MWCAVLWCVVYAHRYFVVFASCFLVLLYFFSKYLLYVMIGIFALMTSLSLHAIITTFAQSLLHRVEHSMTLPYVGKVGVYR